MIRYSRLIGFDNNSFHPDDGEPTIFNGNNRPTAFPTAEPLRTIRITSNEKVTSVKFRNSFFSKCVRFFFINY
jgi:hypothetical protein